MWKQLIELDLDSGVEWTRDSLYGCDPYLVWAEASTRSRADKKRSACAAEPKLPDVGVLVELHTSSDYLLFLSRINPYRASNVVDFFPNGLEQQDTCFVTGVSSYRALAWLVEEVKSKRVAGFALQESRRDLATQIRLLAEDWLMTFLQRDLKADPEAHRRSGGGTYLGLIDDGLPFARVRAVLSAPRNGVQLWDQGWEQRNLSDPQTGGPHKEPPDPDDPYWDGPVDSGLNGGSGLLPIPLPVRGFFYGRRLRWPPNTGEPPGPPGGDDYFRSLYFAPAPRQSHGAAVLGLLAPWLAGSGKQECWPQHISGLAMVQLPTRTVNDTAGGSLAMRVLDGLRFILWQEWRSRMDPLLPRPLVVNLSYGVHGGPHDGSSMLERAFSEALTAHPHLHLVLAAGNAHRTGCHAERCLTEQGSVGATAQLMLRVLPDNTSDTFVEFWLPSDADVVLSIRPPGSTQSYELRRGEARIHADLTGPVQKPTPQTVHFGAVYADAVAQGRPDTMILLAIGNTRPVAKRNGGRQFTPRGLNGRRRRPVLAQSGVWTLTLENLGRTGVTVHAYVERGDAPPDQPLGSRQAYFPDSCTDELRQNNATPEGTLNGIATLRHVQAHVVGAMRVDGRLSDYSAAGPRRDGTRGGSLPDAVVPADWSLNLPGLKTMGFASGAITRINGTSAACAVYARELAVRLAGGTATAPPLPPAPPPEVDCAPERQPSADPALRGEGRRQNVPFEVFPIDRLLRHGMGRTWCEDWESAAHGAAGEGGGEQACGTTDEGALMAERFAYVPPQEELPPEAPADAPREGF